MPDSTDALPDTWTVDDFAKFMDVAYKTALSAVKSGKVPGVIQLSERTYRIVPSAFMDGITGTRNKPGHSTSSKGATAMNDRDQPSDAERAWIVEQRDLMVEKAQEANARALPKSDDQTEERGAGDGVK